MKIQLDFDRKIIKLESSSNLGELFDKIEKILPDWKEWKLETNTVINWNTYPIYPYRMPYYNFQTHTGYLSVNNTTGINTLQEGLTIASTKNYETAPKSGICNIEC